LSRRRVGLGAIALVAACAGCTNDFDMFLPQDDADGSPSRDGGGTSDAGDSGSHPVDAAVDAKPPADTSCTPPPSCLSAATACAATCSNTEATCRANCNNNGCRNQCTATAGVCKAQCATDCSGCASRGGCAAEAACTSAAK
jgi:hypothetical protein